VPVAVTDKVIVSNFNDSDRLHEHFKQYGEQLACFIVEPFLGVGGFAPATREYLQAARELTHQYGAMLIFDEVICGFRFGACDVGTLYGVQPDLSTFGKVIGGGMPVAAVAGRKALLDQAGLSQGRRVRFSGGTYSGHPASMLAARTLLTYLAENQAEVYPRLAALGAKIRQTLVSALMEEGIYARCSGNGNEVLGGSSLFMLHFPYKEDAELDTPEDWWNPAICDVALSHGILDLALLLEDVFMMHSHGAVSTAHTDADIEFAAEACRKAAQRIRPYL
jgi:glutamate-1-semialdehyde 2,1-aminomutase